MHIETLLEEEKEEPNKRMLLSKKDEENSSTTTTTPHNAYSVTVIGKKTNQIIETKIFNSVTDAIRFIEEEGNEHVYDYHLSRKSLLMESI